jgi:chitodextrinase
MWGLSGCNGKAPDKLAPTVPSGIAITPLSSSEIKVSWKPATDDSRQVMGYKVYRNGQYLKTTEQPSVSDTGLTPKMKFCYQISAFDGAGNESMKSPEACAGL